ncbi:integrase [Roseateles aquatilis]|uniref:Integrase n=1 Tax=Roseateles aquatilis TaxID=431061 RepID=A0A246JE43_9BURK|nr:integrase arm-type DNA-binding domain-containing protein [Roseateles aquatilis]OWQ90830.1 integrase [Roseateles aquatilis]
MPGVNLLSVKGIEAALKRAAAAGKAVTVNDGAGLTLEAQPSGAGWWRLRYWVGARANRLSLGTYPDTTLALARQKRDEARQGLAAGRDPVEAKRADKDAATAVRQRAKLAAEGKPLPGSFEFVAREWLANVHQVKVSANHADRTLTRLANDAFPTLGRRPIADIDPPELLQALRRVEARGAIETAHRLKDACSQVFRYGVATGVCGRNPAQDLRDALQPVQTRHHAALIAPAEVAALLRDMAAYSGHPVTKAALALTPLLLLRPGELRQMEWAWVDLDKALLTVPGTVMKRLKVDKASGPPHLVPLAPRAVDVLRELQLLTGGGKFVFPALTTRQRCMSENTVRSALRRMGYSNDDMTAHGFRATARTLIAERLGVEDKIIEAQLAHAVGDALGRAYNRTQYLEQRRDMLQRWAEYLERLREGGDVIDMQSRRA